MAIPAASTLDLGSTPLDDMASVVDWFHDQELTDGLPILPPTRPLVDAAVQATGLPSDEVVGIIDPDRGVATVEKVAVNAVMAGCRPEYLPVLVAAVRAVCADEFNLHGIQCTTNPATPMIVVNGPIRRAIGMNSERGLLGPGNRANASIGRALRLVLRNVGGARTGVDQATQGSPAKYTLCVPEDEEASPWEPMHVERGDDPQGSYVTVLGIEAVVNCTAVWWTPPSLLQMLARTMRSLSTSQYFSRGSVALMLSPAHAGVLARGGYSRRDIREELWECMKVPLSEFPPEGNIPQGDWTVEDDRVLVVASPDDIHLFVAGGTEGNASHSVFFTGFGLSQAVIEPIETAGTVLPYATQVADRSNP